MIQSEAEVAALTSWASPVTLPRQWQQYVAEGVEKPWSVGQGAMIQQGLTVQEKLLDGSHPVTLHVKSQPYIFVRTFIAEMCIRHDFLFFRGRKLRVALSRCERKQQHKTQEHLYLTTARCLFACCSDITTVIIWTHYLHNLLCCMCILLKYWISGGQAQKPP